MSSRLATPDRAEPRRHSTAEVLGWLGMSRPSLYLLLQQSQRLGIVPPCYARGRRRILQWDGWDVVHRWAQEVAWRVSSVVATAGGSGGEASTVAPARASVPTGGRPKSSPGTSPVRMPLAGSGRRLRLPPLPRES